VRHLTGPAVVGVTILYAISDCSAWPFRWITAGAASRSPGTTSQSHMRHLNRRSGKRCSGNCCPPWPCQCARLPSFCLAHGGHRSPGTPLSTLYPSACASKAPGPGCARRRRAGRAVRRGRRRAGPSRPGHPAGPRRRVQETALLLVSYVSLETAAGAEFRPRRRHPL